MTHADFWEDATNRATAEFLGRSVMDAIRFQHQAAATALENEQLRHDLTRERMARAELETKAEALRSEIDAKTPPPRGKAPLPRPSK